MLLIYPHIVTVITYKHNELGGSWGAYEVYACNTHLIAIVVTGD
jgi:hypothetical protein